MKRRTFLASIPLAALSDLLRAQSWRVRPAAPAGSGWRDAHGGASGLSLDFTSISNVQASTVFTRAGSRRAIDSSGFLSNIGVDVIPVETDYDGSIVGVHIAGHSTLSNQAKQSYPTNNGTIFTSPNQGSGTNTLTFGLTDVTNGTRAVSIKDGSTAAIASGSNQIDGNLSLSSFVGAGVLTQWIAKPGASGWSNVIPFIASSSSAPVSISLAASFLGKGFFCFNPVDTAVFTGAKAGMRKIGSGANAYWLLWIYFMNPSHPNDNWRIGLNNADEQGNSTHTGDTAKGLTLSSFAVSPGVTAPPYFIDTAASPVSGFKEDWYLNAGNEAIVKASDTGTFIWATDALDGAVLIGDGASAKFVHPNTGNTRQGVDGMHLVAGSYSISGNRQNVAVAGLPTVTGTMSAWSEHVRIGNTTTDVARAHFKTLAWYPTEFNESQLRTAIVKTLPPYVNPGVLRTAAAENSVANSVFTLPGTSNFFIGNVRCTIGSNDYKSLQLCCDNWWFNANVDQAGSGNTITVDVAALACNGNYVQVFTGASGTWGVADLTADNLTDEIIGAALTALGFPSVAGVPQVPDGTVITLKYQGHVPVGGKLPMNRVIAADYNAGTVFGCYDPAFTTFPIGVLDGRDITVSGTPLTPCTTSAGTGTLPAMWCPDLMGKPVHDGPTVSAFGDSITFGLQDNPTSRGYVRRGCIDSLGRPLAMINCGIPSSTITAMFPINAQTGRVPKLLHTKFKYSRIMIDASGINGGVTVGTVISLIPQVALYAYARSVGVEKIIRCQLTPLATSTATTLQGYEMYRQYWKQGTADYMAEIAAIRRSADPTSTDYGLWPVSPVYSGDNVHPNQAGSIVGGTSLNTIVLQAIAELPVDA